MLTACFDAGGKDAPEHKMLVVAGFATSPTIWREFDNRWAERLALDGLPYFHAAEYAHSTGVFSQGWKGNESRRRALGSDLMRVVRECSLRKFGCILRLPNYRGAHAIRAIEPEAMLEAYAFAAMKVVEQFSDYAKKEGAAEFEYIFERGDPEDQFRKLLSLYQLPQPSFRINSPFKGGIKESAPPFIGLQAADWIAYEYFLDSGRLLDSAHTSDRWAFHQFESLPGDLIFWSSSQALISLASQSA